MCGLAIVYRVTSGGCVAGREKMPMSKERIKHLGPTLVGRPSRVRVHVCVCVRVVKITLNEKQ